MPELTRIELAWADGDYVFDLPLGEIRELQEKVGIGAVGLCRRLNADPRVDDIRETIRLGLIGGGMEPAKALKLVKAYIDERVPMHSQAVAYAVILAWINGAPAVKKKPEPQTQTATEPGVSTSTASTETGAL